MSQLFDRQSSNKRMPFLTIIRYLSGVAGGVISINLARNPSSLMEHQHLGTWLHVQSVWANPTWESWLP